MTTRTILGIACIITGLIIGAYLAGWFCFIGGIVSILNEIKSSEPVSTGTIAWNVLKIMFAGLIFWVSAGIFIIPGWHLVTTD